ncbi:MAG: aminopeptidase P family protein [Acidobacteriota bacterium]
MIELERCAPRRRERTAAAWNLSSEIVLISAGDRLTIPGRGDQTYPYQAHSEYFYLAGRDLPGAVLAFDPQEGWTDFVPEVTQKARVWTGETQAEGTPRSQLTGWLAEREGRPIAVLGSPLPELEAGEDKDRESQDREPDGGKPLAVDADTELREHLHHQLLAVRRPKEPLELELMRRAERATAAGFARVRELLRPGVSERRVQIEIEAEFFRHGGHTTAYDTIVGFGSNAAVLHFSPTERALQDGELILIDAGAEVHGYACDVTRTYPCHGGTFSPEQRDLYDVVLATQERAIARCRQGVEFTEIHLTAVYELTRGLVDFGLLRGAPDSLVEQEAHELFFPHGIGHMVGLGVRDCSGALPGRKQSKRPGLRKLKMNLPLDAGFVVTIEPGVYLVPALLDDPDNRRKHRHNIAWDLADRLRDLGGIRIEDNVLVTDGEPEVLTADIPKRLDEALS